MAPSLTFTAEKYGLSESVLRLHADDIRTKGTGPANVKSLLVQTAEQPYGCDETNIGATGGRRAHAIWA